MMFICNKQIVKLSIIKKHQYMDPYNVNALCCFGVVVFLLMLVILFIAKWRHDSIPIMQVLVILVTNEILYSGSEVVGYIDTENNMLCTVSIIGRMSFSVAANFWIIFITRLIYLQAVAPGKYLDLLKFVFKNIILTYIPSIILSVFLLVIISINNTQSERRCWQIITNKQILDYVIYFTTFILPNFITSLIIIVYLFLLWRLPQIKFTYFLFFSITSLFFSLYFIVIKLYQLLVEQNNMIYWNLLMLGQPIIYGMCFLGAHFKQKQKNYTSSDLTIESDKQHSFIEDL